MDENKQQPFGGNAVPPPPPPEIGVRTMQSDLQSMQKSGGEAPQPYIINSGAATPPRPAAEPAPASQPKITAQGYTGPEQPIFQEANEPVFMPPEQNPPTGGSAGAPVKKGGGFKIIIWLVAILAIAGGLGALGYFVVFPILFPAKPEPIVQEPAPQPEPQPQPEPEPVLPTPEPATTTEPITPTTTAEIIPPTPIAEIKPHISFFTASSAVSQQKVVNDSIALDAFRAAASSTANAMNAGDFKEIVFEKTDGSDFTVADFMTAGIFPNLLASIPTGLMPEAVSQFFEQDFTIFIFKNEQGAWPGYILKTASSADLLTVKSLITAIESSADFNTLFIQNPGAVTQAFKDGKAGEFGTRYQVYAQKGAVLNYAWRANYLVISASYNGLLEALKKL